MTHKARQRRAARQKRQNKMRIITFAAIVLLVLGISGYLFISAFTSKTPPTAANTVDISAAMDGFNMKEMRAKVGQPITVRLTSLDSPYHTDGGGKHQWAIDELGVSIVAPPQGSDSATFTPNKAGVFTFYCDICCGGRANPTMQGKLIVEGV